MLLVLTGSKDGTADLLFSKIGNKGFRFNYDIFLDYSVVLRPDGWIIENPVGLKITNSTATFAFWWKAFNYFVDEENYVAEEVKYIFREIYGWFLSRALTKGNSPEFHRFNGKIQLLKTASAFFEIPKTVCGWSNSLGLEAQSKKIVAKSLTSGLTTTNKALFTTEVEPSRLDPRYPWYLQEKVEAWSDVTIFACGKSLFAFERDRSGLKGLDWRNQEDMFELEQKWLPFSLTREQSDAVVAFLQKLAVDWGRLDFMWTGSKLVFLEYNANGQFAFLDLKNQFGMLDRVVAYLLGECEK
jgi:hypothetical protein